MTIELGSPRGVVDVQSFGKILGWAFGFDPAEAPPWLEEAGLDHVRIARSGERVLGGLIEVPMGQWFGGRVLACLGVAGVAVAPEARGEKVALTLLCRTLSDARRRGFLVSALYPATLTLYRAAGYELAGSRHHWRAPLHRLSPVKSALALTPLESSDASAVESLYARVASARTGYLERGPYVWGRVRSSRREQHLGFGVRGPHGLEGYVYVSLRGQEPERALVVHDVVALTPAAIARLTAFFAEHRSTIASVVLHGSTVEPLVLAAPEQVFRLERSEGFMLRILDAARALEARGYPPLRTVVDLELSDRILPENAGRYRLVVEDGRARVSPGGSGAVVLDERALAALYAGYATPDTLLALGRITGDEESLARLGALFAGPAPAMSDFF